MYPSTHQPTPETTSSTPPTLYFAYGSNLSLTQMSSRCPASTYRSLAVLPSYKWIISTRGYANVVYTGGRERTTSISSSERDDQGAVRAFGEDDVVYGLLFQLGVEDEALLDLAEGVPIAYEKHLIDVEVLQDASKSGSWKVEKQKEIAKALVYVDERRTKDGVCVDEYVRRINRGVKDARERGMPRWYVESVIRRFVREEEVRDGDGEVVEEDPFHPSLIGVVPVDH